MTAEKQNTIPRDGRKARKGRARIRKASTPFRLVNLSVESTLSLRRASQLRRTTIRRPCPARSNTDPRIGSIRMLVGTKAVRDRTWIRVVLLAPGRSLATSATPAAGVGEPSNAYHFTFVNVQLPAATRGEDCTNCDRRCAARYITCGIERGARPRWRGRQETPRGRHLWRGSHQSVRQ
jgi:hypothetical protein